ncbi:hypothetical protein LJR230_000964 [Trinickia sp. LjRoot230]|uniref:hypothetical protein n=1 Tax=Trinickia sp. LjRoot230 TaxID=3342288 RepID=UPI003ED0E95A
MTKFFFYAVLLAMFGVSNAYADTSMPKFEDFPAQVYHGKIASVRIASAQDREFRSRLRESSGQKPNFAGHYSLASWGCGASCVMTVAIDAQTGRTTWLPFTVCCWATDVDEPIKFKADSRLVEITGARNETGGGTYYYVIDKKGFVLVKAVEAAAK